MKNFLSISQKTIILILTVSILTTCVSASKIPELVPEEYSNLLALTKNRADSDPAKTEGFIRHFLYDSDFSAIDGNPFPYPNSGEYAGTVTDGTYTVDNIMAKGCYAYSKFVSFVMLGNFGTKLYHKETEGNLTEDGVRKFIMKNIHAGEHIRMGTFHSLTFVSGDENGFYALGYSSDDHQLGDRKIELVYYTFAEFTAKLNKLSAEADANGRTLYIFDAKKEVNELFDYEESVSVILDKKLLTFDVEPVIINDRTYIPLRAVAESLNADVAWNEATNTAIIEKDGIRTEFITGSHFYKVNGKEVETQAPALVSEGRILVPLRCISESFSLNSSWDDETRCVILTTPVK